MKKKLYLAAPLFSYAELEHNKIITATLEQYFSVYLPQRDGGLMVDMIKEWANPERAAKQVFRSDIEAIKNCQLLLAVLDGRTIDEGVAFEIGFAYSCGIPCYGYQTDPRRLTVHGNNPMISCALKEIMEDLEELKIWASVEWAEEN